MTLKSIELFAGAGGLAFGLHEAGFETQAAIELNKDACSSLRGSVLLGDHCQIVESDIKNHDFAKYPSIDLVSGGPPCQPFSLGGKHAANTDNRDMFPEAVRAIRELSPKSFVFENVKGLLRKSFSTYFEYILLQLQYPTMVKKETENWESHLSRLEKKRTKGDKPEYNIVFRLLNSADYGVPQKRERVIIVGFRANLGIQWAFPKPTHTEDRLLWEQLVNNEYWKRHNLKPPALLPQQERKKASLIKKYGLFTPPEKPWVTVRDAISDLPEPYIELQDGKIKNHIFRDGARMYPGHTGSYIDSPSKTLKAGVHGVPGGENMIRFSDDSVRYFTVRESARMQTFPDFYEVSGSWSEAMRQLGNAVPVALARVIGNSLYEALIPKN
ncbi:DNA cytosine methyltransferase [Marinibactrum halimedae]|uniref:DNA (cytosine-5-)-methyltransferase n=1 Tax=Marinibactrum halimedae TaxID=1444977 RepID=A0AA37TEV6_9GAMM|nr:DNA cytosine methyltransferase [Marinibactrum halimedae]MCD9458867.1 DNA cytosine methyltransferase [Marinibactrum halimedae]GLS27717.1 cytosine-specific methyltransferase [Marinibactrum halimedae]